MTSASCVDLAPIRTMFASIELDDDRCRQSSPFQGETCQYSMALCSVSDSLSYIWQFLFLEHHKVRSLEHLKLARLGSVILHKKGPHRISRRGRLQLEESL